MHISNFRKVKRVEDVVGVFEGVQKKIPSKLLLVGDGPERQKIEMLCREKQIHSHIIFLGKVSSPENILPIADVFLLTSETESFGLAALEAMAVGVPVISSNTGGIPEVNIDGVTGFLSDVGDVEDMAANALKLLLNEERLTAFKKNALLRAHDFDLVKILPMYEQIYFDLVGKSEE
jgi:N-acetyl-alpha-D-glucosaminyl L-malate synthase BshA